MLSLCDVLGELPRPSRRLTYTWPDGRLLVDELVHERLRVPGLVAFVVAVAAVAVHVDDDVLPKRWR
jgi:hypothetical protein